MKVTVVPSRRNSKEFTIELEQGAQYFRLDYSGPKIEARWYAKMFRVALKKHDQELARQPVAKTRKPRKSHVVPMDSSAASA